MIGHEISDYFAGEQNTYNILEPLFSGKENFIYVRSSQRRKDGEVRVLAWSCSSMKDPKGDMSGALFTARDITDINRADEDIRRQLIEKEVLLKEVHHRIKNNMNTIMSLLNIQSKT